MGVTLKKGRHEMFNGLILMTVTGFFSAGVEY